MDTNTPIDIAEPDQFADTGDSASESQQPSPEQAIPVHPLAASFPMLDAEELDALADQIRANGLRNPIVLDQAGQLLDGRNRLAACKLAGVEPKFETTDAEPVAYILSANVHRRHLSKGQQAMLYAKAYPEATEKGGRGQKSPTQLGSSMSELVRQARLVLHYLPELAGEVVAGETSLKDAYNRATEKRDEQEQFERLMQEVRDGMSAIASVSRRWANIELGKFVDQGDFVRQVRSDVKEIFEEANRLKDIV